MMRVQHVGLLVIGAALLAGCSDGSSPDPDICPQTYEFGNYGCANVRGVVLEFTGTPRASAMVRVRHSTYRESEAYGATLDWTDSEGRFTTRITRWERPADTSEPDWVSLWVIAAVRRADASLDFTRADSVLVRAEVAPVGRAPQPVEMEIRLRDP